MAEVELHLFALQPPEKILHGIPEKKKQLRKAVILFVLRGKWTPNANEHDITGGLGEKNDFRFIFFKLKFFLKSHFCSLKLLKR